MPGTPSRSRLPRLPKWDDELPENAIFRDDGCAIHPHCLSCPLPCCKYDAPQEVRRLLSLPRDSEIVRLRRQEGLSVNALARRYGLSRRSVFRILRRWAEAEAAAMTTQRLPM